MDLLVLLDAKWYGHCHQQSEDELDKQPPRLQRGSAGSLSDAAAHEQADVPPPQRRRPSSSLHRSSSQCGSYQGCVGQQGSRQQTRMEWLGTWAGRQRIFAEHLRQEEQELEPQRPRRPTAAGQHAGSPEAPTAAAEAGSAPEEAALPEASLRQHGNTPVVLAPPPLARPAAAEPSAIPEPTLDAEMNAAWRWRFTRKWQAEQMKQFDAAPEGGGGDDEEEWAAALRLMDATDGLNMQIGRTLSLHTSSMADGSMGLEQSLTLISPMDQSLSQCMLLDMDGSVKEPLRDDTAAATSQLVSVARKAQHLRRQQQEIERQVTERWEAAAGGPEWVAQHLPAVQIDSWSAFAFVLVRLTEPRSQRQKLLVRGRNGTTEQQAFATVEQEAARAAVARRLPGPKVDLLACGRMEWVAPPSNGQRRTLLVRVSRLLPPATKDARLHSAAAASGVVAELTRSSLPSGDFEVATADSFASGSK